MGLKVAAFASMDDAQADRGRMALSREQRSRYPCGVQRSREHDMRPEHGARRAIIRQWMSLPRDKRHTEEQAAAFAVKAIEKHDFPCSGDRQLRVMAWLLPRTGKP
jgi:hypothetical protein